jgi:hypothetical protein
LACALTYGAKFQAFVGRVRNSGDFFVIRHGMTIRIHCDDEGEEREEFGKQFF